MEPSLGIVRPTRRAVDQQFHSAGRELGVSLADFWAWSSSDLLVNTNRGLLAEFFVSQALGDLETVRDPWRTYDVLSRTGVSVEVKSGAYIQSWAQKRHSDIVFSISPSRAWDPATGLWEEEQRRQAQVYVFCLLAHKDQASVDPTDLSQWRFHVVRTKVLDQQLDTAKTVSLSRLTRLDPIVAGFDDLESAVLEAAGPRD